MNLAIELEVEKDNEATATATATDTETATATETATETTTQPIPLRQDLVQYALDFMDDEVQYYDIIKSYTHEKDISLFICKSGLICAHAIYYGDGSLREVSRNDTVHVTPFSPIEDWQKGYDNSIYYSAIQDWYNHYNGESTSVFNTVNNVFIGEDLVPLWKVLEVYKDEQEVQQQPIKVVDDEHRNMSMAIFLLYTYVSLLFVSITVPIYCYVYS